MKQKNNKLYILLSLAVILIIGGVVLASKNSSPGKYDEFAVCLGEKGATFYGTYWCPYCNEQKKLFGKSSSKIPYVECSLPGGKGQTQVCKDAGIKAYPTWEFANGERQTGVIKLDELAEKTGCELPQDI